MKLGLVASVAGIAAAFALGRFTAPEQGRKELTHEVALDAQVDKEEKRAKVAEEKKAAEATEKILTEEEETRPDGTKLKRRKVESRRAQKAEEKKASSDIKIVEREKLVFKDREVLRIIEAPQRNWYAGGLIGMTWDKRTIAGGELKYRLVGPFTVGGTVLVFDSQAALLLTGGFWF